MWISKTITIVAMINGFASIERPPKLVVGESPIIPAEDIGIEMFDLFKDIGITCVRKII